MIKQAIFFISFSLVCCTAFSLQYVNISNQEPQNDYSVNVYSVINQSNTDINDQTPESIEFFPIKKHKQAIFSVLLKSQTFICNNQQVVCTLEGNITYDPNNILSPFTFAPFDPPNNLTYITTQNGGAFNIEITSCGCNSAK